MCPGCRLPVATCICGAKARPVPGADGVVRVSRETQRRGGKTVTVVRGVDLDTESLAALGKRLRATCGAGGTVKDGVLEVQGDHCERVIEWLTRQGWKVKRSSG